MIKQYKITLRVILFFTILIGVNKDIRAQEGTEFWFAAPEVTSNHADRPVYIRLTCGNTAATYTVSMPARSANFTPITGSFAANTSVSYRLDNYLTANQIDSIENKPTNTVLNRGLLIESSNSIYSYYEVTPSNNSDIFALKGPSALGTEFYIPLSVYAEYPNHVFGSAPLAYASFDIVATEDNTTILIYPTKAIDGHAALTSFTVTLNRGQTYSSGITTGSYQLPSNHPSGSVVVSDKPIAITIKDDSNHNNAGATGCYDLMGDQIVPVNILGQDYIVVKGQLTARESAFIMAVQNNTKVYVDGSTTPVATLFAGEVYTHPMTSSTVYFTTSKPAYCMHVTGFGCEMGMAILPPLNCAGSSQVGFVRSTPDPEIFYLTILVRTGAEGAFQLNGSTTAVTAGMFTTVAGTGGLWKSAQVTFNDAAVPTGTAMLLTNSMDVFSMGLVNGGGSTGCRYGYFSEFLAPIYVDAGSYPTVCANDTLELNGSVTGGSLQGIWTTAGTGIFLPDNTTQNGKYIPSALDAANGSVQLTLTSSSICNPVDDAVTINFTPAPIINAGGDVIICRNAPTVSLNASVTIASGGLWTGGAGTFASGTTALTNNYLPTAGELALDSLTLTLTSTGNGICNAVTDQMKIYITPTPTVNAGPDQSICKNNPSVSLSGSVSVATGGIWSGGAGAYSLGNTNLNSVYTPTAGEIASGSLTLTLTTTGFGTCTAVTDEMTITFTNAPAAYAGSDQTLCKNNSTVSLSGAVSVASGGSWSGGAGAYNPSNTSLVTGYTPTAGELSAGSVKLILTTTGNGNCIAATHTMTVSFTESPTSNAGTDQTLCANNSGVSLSGSVSVATGGTWSGGAGAFNPSNTSLVTGYTPTAGEISAGVLTLTLTTTGNGSCNAVANAMNITFTNAPTSNAGTDQFVCKNNPNVSLSGAVSIATGGTWSGGSGSYNPSINSVTSVYTPTAGEIAAGTLELALTTTGNGSCVAVTNSVTITFTNPPTANAGSDQTICSGNSASLNGSVTIAGGGLWSNGLGSFSPNNGDLSASYVPTSAEISAGSVNLILTTSSNGNCNSVKDTVKVSFKSDVAAFNYASGTHCISGTDPTPNITGDPGTFSASPSGMAFLSTVTGQIDVSACTVQSYTVSFTTSGSCPVSAKQSITITNTPDASHSYSAIPYCGSDPNPLPTFPSGASAGVFSSVPAGLVFVSTGTGQINLAASGPGNYTITNFIAATGGCVADTKTSTATIQQAATADASTDQTVCVNTVVTLAGSIGGSAASSTWSGGSGIFGNSSSPSTTYTPASGETNVTLTLTTNDPAGTCNPASDIMTITINTDNPAFSYPSGTFCQTGSDPYPNISGGYTGTFTSDPLFVFVSPTSGQIDVSASAVGTHTITFTTNGSCPASSKQVVTIINTSPDASFSFSGPYCQGAANPFPVFPGGASAGVFSATPAGLSFANASSGEIDLSSSSQGTYQVSNYIEASGSCTSDTKTANVTIDAKAIVDAGSDQSACTDNSLNMSGFVGGSASSGTWSGGTGSYSPNSSALNAVYTPGTGETSALLILTTNDPAGVCGAVSDSIDITISDQPPAPTSLDKSVCPGDSATLIATDPGGLYQWYNSDVGGSLLKTSSTYVTPALSVTSTFYVQTTIEGCASARTPVSVSVVASSEVDAGSDKSACKNNPSIQMNAYISTGAGQWTSTGSGTFTPDNTTINAIYIASAADIATGTGDLILTSASGGSCASTSDTLTFSLTNSPVPVFSYTGNCVGDAVQFVDSSYVVGSSITSWAWDFGDNSISIVEDPTHVYSASGTYDVKLIVESGCEDSITNPITINPKPLAGFSVTATSFLINDLVVFTDASSGANSWLWDFGDSRGPSTLASTSHTYEQAGLFPVTQIVTNTSGCSDTASINITVISSSSGVYPPKIPSGFSPNNDGDNDLLLVRGGPFKSLHFRIYNTWGEMIFETTDTEAGWDGYWKGIKQSMGSYVYTIEGVTIDDKSYIKSGNVKLIE